MAVLSASSPLTPGAHFGHYLLSERLFVSSDQQVYRARDERLWRPVLVCVTGQPTTGPADVQTLTESGRAVAGLSHPHIAAVHDVGGSNEGWWSVIEDVHGVSLKTQLSQVGRFSVEQVLDIARQVCSALAYAHRRDMAHRRLSPDHVLLTSDGQAKLIGFCPSFGSQAGGQEEASDAQAGTWISPEQLAGSEGDERSDLYALGALMYQMLYGAPPGPGAPRPVVDGRCQRSGPAPGPGSPAAPEGLVRAIGRLLQRDPAARYASAPRLLRVLAALRPAAVHEGEQARPVDNGENAWPLVGRQTELGMLRDQLRAVLSGTPSMVLIEGEAGIGKTRLLQELAATLPESFRVVSCSCRPDVPYGAFAGVLAHLAGEADAGVADVKAIARYVAYLGLPELLPLVEQISGTPSAVSPPMTAFLPSGQRVLWAMWRILASEAARRPLALLLDDLHRADLGSLSILDFAARQLKGVPLLLVVACRPEALIPGGECALLARALPELEKLELCRRMILGRLGASETGVLAAAGLGSPLPADLCVRLYEETEGHPLFVVETLRWMKQTGLLRRSAAGTWSPVRCEAGPWLPESLQSAIRRRCAQVPAEDQELLRCAAVAGLRFTSAALIHVLSGERLTVLRSLDRLEHIHRLVVHEKAGYRFSHAKIREVLYADVTPELRIELHRRLGEFGEREPASSQEPPVLELAEHFLAAGVAGKACRYLRLAGDQARKVHAHQVALRCYERALPLTVSPPEAATLRRQLGEAAASAGDTAAAVQHFERLLEGGLEERSRLVVRQALARAYELAQRRSEARSQLEQALAELGDWAQAPERASLLTDLAFVLQAHFNDFAGARALNQECRELLRGYRDDPAWLRLYHNLGVECSCAGRLHDAAEYEQQRLELAERLHDESAAALAALDIAGLYQAMGDDAPENPREWSERAVVLARRVGDLRLVAEGLARQGTWLSLHDQSAAGAALTESLEICTRMGYAHPLAMILDCLGRVLLAGGQARRIPLLLEPGIERLLGLGVDGIYPARCLTRALASLERAWTGMEERQAYAAFCQRVQAQRPEELAELQPRQWLLLPAVPSAGLLDSTVEETDWSGVGLPEGWRAVEDTAGRCHGEWRPGPPGLTVQARRSPLHVVHDYGVDGQPPRLIRVVTGEWLATVTVAAMPGESGKAGAMVAWRDPRSYALLIVDARDEVHLYVQEDRVLRLVGRGYLPGEVHWLGFQRCGNELVSLCSVDGRSWWTAGGTSMDGDPVEVGLYPATGTAWPGESPVAVSRYGAFRLQTARYRKGIDELHSAQPAAPPAEVAVLGEWSRMVAEELGQTTLLPRVVRAGVLHLAAQRACAILRDAVTGECRVAAGYDGNGGDAPDLLQERRILVEQVLATGRSVCRPGPGCPGWNQEDGGGYTADGSRACCLILGVRGQQIGALVLEHHGAGGFAQAAPPPICAALADHLAVAAVAVHADAPRGEPAVRTAPTEGNARPVGGLLGGSPAMQRVYVLLAKVLESPAPVVILGESGTGKELVARAIHHEGPRREGQFVAENCAVLPEQLLESELFGHARGAYTGADRDKPGLFEVADSGTLFLDEITETSPAVQAKLLRALEEREIRRLGDTRPRPVDVRLLAATSRDLFEEVKAGRFRTELYYRLSVLTVALPPLRDRLEDVPVLADHFLQDYCRRAGKVLAGFSRDALEALQEYRWPGNVRELRNEVERMAAMAEPGGAISRDLVSARVRNLGSPQPAVLDHGESLHDLVERTKRQAIEEALRQCHGSRTRAAARLGMSRTNLQMMMKRLGMLRSGQDS